MKSVLVDSGPLIAAFDKDDKYHKDIIDFFKKFKGELVTTWPVITEVTYMLNFNYKVQLDFLNWISDGNLKLFDLRTDNLERIIKLIDKYSDIPMDLADASLIVVSEAKGFNEIISIDSDFYIFKNIRDKFLKNIFK